MLFGKWFKQDFEQKKQSDIFQFEQRNIFLGFFSNFALNVVDCNNRPAFPTDLNATNMADYQQVLFFYWDCQNFMNLYGDKFGIEIHKEGYQNIMAVQMAGYRDYVCTESDWACWMLPSYPQ